jgi:hypothetical protein
MPRKGQFQPGNAYRFQPGESGNARARARFEVAVDILRQGRDEPEVRGILDQVARTVADPVDRVRRSAQELAPYCLEQLAGAMAADSHKLLAYVGPVRVRLDAALHILKLGGLGRDLALDSGPSDRFRAVIDAWFADHTAPPPPTPLPPDPAEPSRRRRDRNRPSQADESGS